MNAITDSAFLAGPDAQSGAQQPLRDVALDDKYTAQSGSVYLSGIQALVRLPLIQRLRDQAAGLNTAGFVSGYRGSPLGGLDEAFWKAEPHLAAHHVKFLAGTNEELAATAVWGTQQLHLMGESDYDGVFAMWYAKGPGVDRSIDVLKHLNYAGSSPHGGVLLVAGDDHGAYSSTLPNQSDHVFSASMIPVLYPCNVQEYIELGLHGWAMSRFSGCAVGFKALADTVESSASIDADPFAVEIKLPESFAMPEGGLNCRASTDTLGVQARKQEALLQDYKIYAAMAYARANRLNRVAIDSAHARLGIVASGKSYLDVLDALAELGIDEALAGKIGIRVFKVSMPWPLEPEGIREFSRGLDEILVVEEKRQVVEYQLKEQLYNWQEDVRPRVIGKFDERGEWDTANERGRGDWLLSACGDFSVAQIARVITARIGRLDLPADIRELIQDRMAFLEEKDAVLQRAVGTPPRPAYFCSGCPHNNGTKVPSGSFALAGIGCHIMATAIYPESNKLNTQMGGEGVPWIGAAAFSKVPHVFANLGDGTYFHSGYLAIRAAVAASRRLPVNITYKILYNDAVAMTGGQPVDGPIGVAAIARQMLAEGVKHVALVTENRVHHEESGLLPPGLAVHDRGELDAVQREFRNYEGVSVIIYDQTCAAEKRRRRKKKEMVDPPTRAFINQAVCEGCGDCGVQSNCTSILPAETEFGRKRKIDQSSCNKDFSCVKGFCPSFVTVTGGQPRKASLPKSAAASHDALFADLPSPVLPQLDKPFNILITGIGGTGILTVGALLGMAAHMEGKRISVLDMTGMSQKNGAVTSHVRFARADVALHTQRIATGEADLILGCDMLTAGAADAIAKARGGRTRALVNTHLQPTGEFARDPDWHYPEQHVRDLITEAVGGNADFVDATRLATALLGDSIGSNLFMLGFAYQRGAIPVSVDAIMRAIDLNGVAPAFNKQAFNWGRLAAVRPDEVQRIATPQKQVVVSLPESLKSQVDKRAAFLAGWQNEKYAARYRRLVEAVRDAEKAAVQGDSLTRAVARGLFKLMAYKDEYEVARLYTDGSFRQQLEAQFEGDYKLTFHLAPPMLSRKGADGKPVKRTFGPWMMTGFKVLARLRGLRGTPLDVFGYTDERRMERALITEYEALITQLLPRLKAETRDTIVALARLPDDIRGYGHVKEASVEKARARQRELLAQLDAPVQAGPTRRRA